MKRTIHLICNAHLDPVWQWEWQEGAAEALSTFRTAVELCEKNDSFIFNHNEAILYQWIEEYDPELFERIKKLVKAGKWQIMGGWFLQPDCNMPCGESFVRQISTGREYFKRQFGVEPKTAINFDPFGHTRGLVQIMAQSGYDSYLIGRPEPRFLPLPDEDFRWIGYDGSELLVSRIRGGYNTWLGEAAETIRQRIDENYKGRVIAILWGVGNHGGGPSRKDLKDVNELIKKEKNFQISHSSTKSFFNDLRKLKAKLPKYEMDLNPFAVGCYTSMIRIKQKHRQLENDLFMAEKMASSAAFQGFIDYPKQQLDQAQYGLMLSQFHDILPGSSIEDAENSCLRLLEHGLEILSRVKLKSFFALSSGLKKAKDGQIPILVYNPHPWKIKQVVECEFQLGTLGPQGKFTDIIVSQNGKQIPSQTEKESPDLDLDWRKKVSFLAELKPNQINRYDCTTKLLPKKPTLKMKVSKGKFKFETKQLNVEINTRTGLIDKYQVKGKDILLPGSFKPVIVADNEDSWGIHVTKINKVIGNFKLASAARSAQISGVKSQKLNAVRLVEDGPVRSIVEAVFEYGDSYICQQYKLPKQGTEVEIATKVNWNQKSTMLKLAVNVKGDNKKFVGQVAYGVGQLPLDGTEAVCQKWLSVFSKKDNLSFTCINDGTYGSHYKKDVLYLNLVRSPLYTAAAGPGVEDYFVQDRYRQRMDIGIRNFNFWINGGTIVSRANAIESEAIAKNEKPYALSFFPSGKGAKVKPFLVLDNNVVQVAALKKAEKDNNFVIRLFEPTGKQRTVTVRLPSFGAGKKIQLEGFEIKTLKFNVKKRAFTEVDLLERKLKKK